MRRQWLAMGKEDLGTSLRMPSCETEDCAPGKNSETPGRHLGERPGQTDPVIVTLIEGL